jgi:hypothetical protein
MDGGDFLGIEGHSSSHLARWHGFGDALAQNNSAVLQIVANRFEY